MKIIRRIAYALVCLAILVGGSYWYLSSTDTPAAIQYGVSFNTPYARELGLDWREVYSAILEDLGVKQLRLAAHWPMVEPEQGQWNFEELDYQVAEAGKHDARVVLAVGRRLPRWPECHVPEWAQRMSWEDQKKELRIYLEKVVSRYKNNPTIAYWQVENEPFLGVYATTQCGELDVDFLDEEIALVRALDPDTPVLVTDSGNLGLWYRAYRRGDVFGTSVYLYLWNEATGPFRSFLPPSVYRAKGALLQLLFGYKEIFLIELSLEPWLNKPITEASMETQLTRMNPEKFDEILAYARETRFGRQYLWGAEWWYWLKLHGDDRMWERARALYAQ